MLLIGNIHQEIFRDNKYDNYIIFLTKKKYIIITLVNIKFTSKDSAVVVNLISSFMVNKNRLTTGEIAGKQELFEY